MEEMSLKMTCWKRHGNGNNSKFDEDSDKRQLIEQVKQLIDNNQILGAKEIYQTTIRKNRELLQDYEILLLEDIFNICNQEDKLGLQSILQSTKNLELLNSGLNELISIYIKMDKYEDVNCMQDGIMLKTAKEKDMDDAGPG